MLRFPGFSSRQMSHYSDIHLEDKSIDTVILHVGVNDLLRTGVRNIFVSRLVNTTRVSLLMLERFHYLISSYYRENACFYIDK